MWNPYLFLGVPFLANPQTGVLYPPSWLFALGPVHVVYSAQLVLHVFLAALSTYLLLRRAFGVAPLAASIGGLAYGFGGFAVGQVGHLNQLSAAAWLPAVLLAYARFVQTPRPHWIGLGALALGLQLLAGHPQETYMTLIVLGVFAAVTAPWRRPLRLLLAGLGAAVVCLLGADLAAAQLLPTLELAPLSIRGTGVNWRDAVAGSLPSFLAVRALFPPFWIDVPNMEFLGYVGVAPITLGMLALLRGAGKGVLFGGLLCFLGVFLALGENNGAYAWVFQAVPGFDTFRVPARWLLVWQFGMAVLAGLGADWIARGARVCLREPMLWLRVVLVSTVLLVGLAWQQEDGEPFAQRRTPGLWAAIAATTIALGASPHLRRPQLGLVLLTGLVGVELFAAADFSPARQAPSPLFTPGESVDWLRQNGATDADRVLSLARPEYLPVREPELRAKLDGLPETAVTALLVAQKWRDTLAPNVPMQFGLATADGYDGGVLPLQRWFELSGLLVAEPRPDGVLLSRLQVVPADRMLDLLGVRYLIVNGHIDARPGLRTIDFGDLRLFVRPNPVPRSLLVFSASSSPTDSVALNRLSSPGFDPNREVVLADGPPQASDRASAAVVPDAQRPGYWHARVAAPEPAYLLQRESWYPGWRARVDGVDAPVIRADLLFRAVSIPPGEHEVEIFFDSASFSRGAWLSCLGLLLSLVLLISRWLPIISARTRRMLSSQPISSPSFLLPRARWP